MFRIIFVLDILNGNAVHAVRGERAKYRPFESSRICSSSAPLDILSAISPGEVYIADLDRLQHLGNNYELIRKISKKNRTMVDIGAADIYDVEKCAMIANTIILGTETASFDLIEEACRRFPGRINVSIDMKNRRVLAWDMKMELKPIELVRSLNRLGIRDIILLELSRVGTAAGIDVVFLKETAGASTHNILVGGGIRDMRDIDALKEIGIGGALVATAVHNGKIPVDLLR